jgi:hypothetical protein
LLALSGIVFVPMSAMPTVHEEMHQRAREEHKIGQDLRDMHPMLNQQEQAESDTSGVHTPDQYLS